MSTTINHTAAAWRAIQCHFELEPDGQPGGKTLAALAAALKCSQHWPAVQHAARATPDGIPGVKTAEAITERLGITVPPIYTETEIRSGKTPYGKGGDVPLVRVAVPDGYPLTYDGKRVSTISVHAIQADNVRHMLAEIAAAYKGRMESAPGICIYDGSYNDRSTTKGGAKSIHAWGLALDFYAAENGYSRTKAKGARLARAEYDDFRRILRRHGFFSLGERSNIDWMHFQAVWWL